jgi:hypothetical protein
VTRPHRLLDLTNLRMLSDLLAGCFCVFYLSDVFAGYVCVVYQMYLHVFAGYLCVLYPMYLLVICSCVIRFISWLLKLDMQVINDY